MSQSNKPLLYGPDGKAITKGANLDPDFWIRGNRGKLSSEAEATQREPYAKHPIVFACCNAITMNLCQLPHVLHPVGKPEKIETEDPFLDLLLKPNPLMSGHSLWEITLLHLLLPTKNTTGGQCFWIPVDGLGHNFEFTSGNLPLQIYPFSSEYVKAWTVPERDELLGWKLCLPGGETLYYRHNEIIRFNLSNPYNYYQGMSPLSSALTSMRQDAKANELNDRFYDNNGALGGVLQTDLPLTPDTAKEMINAWREEYAGADKTGKIGLLHSGLKYTQFERKHTDMQFVEQKKFNRDEIMAVYRVPKAEIAMYEDVNYATATSADKSFWKKTLLPYDKLLWSTINISWLRYYERGKWRGKSDTSDVEALQEDFKDKVTQMKTLYEVQVPVEESARLLRMPIQVGKYPWLGAPLVQSSLVPIDGLEEAREADAKAKAEAAAAQAEANKKPEDDKKEEDATDKTFSSIIRNIEKSYKTHDEFLKDYLTKVMDPSEKDLRKTLNKYFVRQRNLVLDAIDKWAKKKSKAIDVDVTGFFENLDDEDDILKSVTDPIFEDQIKAQADEMEDELGHGLNDWDIDSDKVKAIKEKRLEEITNINTTTFKAAKKKIGKILSDMPQDITVQELSKQLKKGISSVYQIRIQQARTIARTEIGILSSQIRHDIMKEEGVNKHMWLSVIDEKTRQSHIDENGEIVAIGEDFPHTHLEYPLDPSGEPEDIINCRCTTIPVKD